MRLTVGVCTHNPHEEPFARALESISSQVQRDPDAEFLVVDNNSTPPLEARTYLKRFPITLLHESTPGLTAAREAIISHATGEVIVFVDDDNVLHDDYLQLVRDAFMSDSNLGLLGGAVVPEYEVTPPPWMTGLEDSLAIRPYPPDLRVRVTTLGWSEHFPIGAGMSVRRSLAEAYVADCAATTRIQGRRGSALSSGEDLDLGLFVLSQGRALAVDGRLRLTHIIGARRIQSDYLQSLATANMRSSWELERKWAPRLGRRVFPMFGIPLPVLVARIVVLTALSPVSPRYRVRRRVYGALLRAKFGRL